MGAWAKDSVPGAAGAMLDLGPGRWTSVRGRPLRRQAQSLSPMRPWALGFRNLYNIFKVLYYNIIYFISCMYKSTVPVPSGSGSVPFRFRLVHSNSGSVRFGSTVPVANGGVPEETFFSQP